MVIELGDVYIEKGVREEEIKIMYLPLSSEQAVKERSISNRTASCQSPYYDNLQ